MLRRAFVSIFVAAIVAGPLAASASADDSAGCRLAEKLGVKFVKECGTQP